jgi:CRISPR/Cas system-associated endonuclease Cas1
MVLDLIEEFRQVTVDRAMITLAARKKMRKGDVEGEEGVHLNKEGRAKAIEALMRRFDTEVRHRGRRTALRDVILRQAREVVRFLNRETMRYTPFIYR